MNEFELASVDACDLRRLVRRPVLVPVVDRARNLDERLGQRRRPRRSEWRVRRRIHPGIGRAVDEGETGRVETEVAVAIDPIDLRPSGDSLGR